MADSDVGNCSKYGEVSSSIIAKDRLTGTSRGFGFVTLPDASSFQLALHDHHVIAGRVVEVKRAIPRNEQQSNTQQLTHRHQQQQYSQGYHSYTSKGSGRTFNGNYGTSNNDQSLSAKKIFVGGLSANLTEDEFKSYFEKFGRITDVVVMHDCNTNRPRGFGFITFDSEEVVEKLMQMSHHELGGKRVEVKRAVPRDATKSPNNGHNLRFGGGRFSPVPGQATYINYPAQYPVSTAYPACYYGAVYGGGYPFGGCNVYGYGMPVAPPRSPSSFGFRPLPYGTGYYSTGNGAVAFVEMFHGYNGFVDTGGTVKPGQYQGVNGNAQLLAKNTARQMNGAKPVVDSSGVKMGKGVLNTKKNSRIADAQVPQSKVATVGQSS
ncbi:RNA-binding protein 1 [Bienertia sinuspersici]